MSANELSAPELNNEIVRLRPFVKQARVRLTKRLIRSITQLRTRKSNNAQLQTKNDRKVERLLEEINALKTLTKDEPTKLALVNLKTQDQLLKGATSARDRALYKLIGMPQIQERIDVFREKFPMWHKQVPFILQRLGLQQKHKKKPSDSTDVAIALPVPRSQTNSDEIEGPEPVRPVSDKKITKKMKNKKATDVVKSDVKCTKPTKSSKSESGARTSSSPPSTSVVQRIDLDTLFADGADQLTIASNKNGQKSEKLPMESEKTSLDASKLSFKDSFFNETAPSDADSESETGSAHGLEWDNDSGSDQDDKIKSKSRKYHDVNKRHESKSTKSRDRRFVNAKTSVKHQQDGDRSHRRPTNTTNSNADRKPKSLHPSWEARRKQMDQQKLQPAGKRTKFNDESD